MGIYCRILQLQPNFRSLNVYRTRLIELFISRAGAEFLSLTVHKTNSFQLLIVAMFIPLITESGLVYNDVVTTISHKGFHT